LPKDACYKKIKRTYKVFPSARASQAIAKCRKGKGKVRKTEKGSSLRRWEREDWRQQGGQPCGAGGKKTPYCRPTKRVSSKTPKTKGEMSKSELARKRRQKSKVGRGRRVSSLKRK